MTNVSAQIASVYGAYLWPSTDGPRYVIGFSASAAFSFASIIMAWLMRYALMRENRKVKQDLAAGAVVNTYGY
jgi:hypothetical protein